MLKISIGAKLASPKGASKKESSKKPIKRGCVGSREK